MNDHNFIVSDKIQVKKRTSSYVCLSSFNLRPNWSVNRLDVGVLVKINEKSPRAAVNRIVSLPVSQSGRN